MFNFIKTISNNTDNISTTSINSCSICLSQYSDKTKKILNCNHCFHEKCIDGWLTNNNTCPLCRSTITPITLSINKITPTPNNIVIRIPNYNQRKFKIRSLKLNIFFKYLFLVLFIITIISHVGACIYNLIAFNNANNYINKYIKNLNETELGEHDYNTYNADLLITTDIFYYFFFFIGILNIIKKNEKCCSKGCAFFFLAAVFIIAALIREQFFSNTNKYLNDFNINTNDYKYNLVLSTIIYGSLLGSKLCVCILTSLYWI